jgi:hypothetical protein
MSPGMIRETIGFWHFLRWARGGTTTIMRTKQRQARLQVVGDRPYILHLEGTIVGWARVGPEDTTGCGPAQ